MKRTELLQEIRGMRFEEAGKSAPSQHPIPLEGSTLFRNMPAGDSGGSQQVFVI
jgi:hypothetical protein